MIVKGEDVSDSEKRIERILAAACHWHEVTATLMESHLLMRPGWEFEQLRLREEVAHAELMLHKAVDPDWERPFAQYVTRQ